MFEKIKALFGHIYYLLEDPQVMDVIHDIKVAGSISGGVSIVLKIMVPELAHGLSLLFWGGTCTIAFFFLRRWLKKTFPDHVQKIPTEPDTEDQP